MLHACNVYICNSNVFKQIVADIFYSDLEI